MSAGLDIIFDNLIASEKRKLCTSFGLSDTDEGFVAVKARLAREGTRLATAGDKLAGLFIAEYSPNPLFIGEFISFFTSNTVMTAYITDFLELPFEYRPGVNPLRLGDLFFAFMAMGAQYSPEQLKSVATIEIRRFERVKKNFIAVIEWLLNGRDITQLTVEEMRRDVQKRTEQSAEERKERARKMVGASVTCEEYNMWHRNRHNPPLNHNHPVVRLRYMTRSGQERQIFACLCCAAVEPKDCICAREEEVIGQVHSGAKVSTVASSKSANIDQKIPSTIYTGNDDDDDRQQQEKIVEPFLSFNPKALESGSPSKSAYPSDHNHSAKKPPVTLQQRYHTGYIEECRMTKTKALKIQNIAIWSCCGAEAAKVNTTPIGYEVYAERDNGCKGPGAESS